MNKAQTLTDTRAILLATELELFAEQSYNGAGIKEIVDSALCRFTPQLDVSGWRKRFGSYLSRAQADGSVRTD